jgi:hypothetical protein
VGAGIGRDAQLAIGRAYRDGVCHHLVATGID